MRELASYKTALDANLDKAFLESQGMEIRIENEYLANAQPLHALALGVKLFVREDDLERARQLLKDNHTSI